MIHYSLEEIGREPKSVVTVGTFDGMHVAHRRIVNTLVEKTRATGGRSVVITFKPHPQEILGSQNVELLMTEEERVSLMENSGVDEICLLRFDRDLSLVTAEDFLVKMVCERIGLQELVLGYNHTFGNKAQGTVEFARKVGERMGFKVDFLDKVLIDGIIVSSSNIRRLLKEGDVARAGMMLGRPYALEGFVIRGNGRGRLLGFPTANLKLIDERLLMPAFGVYIAEVALEGGKFVGLASIGVRPTFEDSTVPMVEIWISDFDAEIYGKRIRISLIQRLRDEMKFDSSEELIAQMDEDKKLMSEYLVRTVNKKR
jgi:riboflavin kinase/FMN adenylyltransferase